MSIYFTADTHFGHQNIIKYSNRPFITSEEMDEKIIENWNKTIDYSDTVYHLGDIFLCDEHRALSIIKRLNGNIFLIKGNHEKTAFKVKDRFGWIRDYFETYIEDQCITMFHYPMMSWNKAHHGAWALHGHCHNSLQPHVDKIYTNAKILDVGVDSVAVKFGQKEKSDYRPISFKTISKFMATKSGMAVDHHSNKKENE